MQCVRTVKLKQLKRIQPSLSLLFTPVAFLLWHVKNVCSAAHSWLSSVGGLTEASGNKLAIKLTHLLYIKRIKTIVYNNNTGLYQYDFEDKSEDETWEVVGVVVKFNS